MYKWCWFLLVVLALAALGWAWPWSKPTFDEDARIVQSMAVSNNVWAVDDMKTFERFAKQAGWKFEIVSIMDGDDGKTYEIGSISNPNLFVRLLESGIHLSSRFPVRTPKGELAIFTREQINRILKDVFKVYGHSEYYNEESCYSIPTVCKLIYMWHSFANEGEYPDPKLILPTEVKIIRKL
jgi:hypothetical protein